MTQRMSATDADSLGRRLLDACNVQHLSEILSLSEASISPIELLQAPNVLSQLTSLRQVDFSGFPLRLPSGESADVLLEELRLLKSLRILRLSRCSLSTARFLIALPHVHVLDISKNTIFDLGDLEGAEKMATNLQKPPYTAALRLQSLDISFNSLPELGSLCLENLSELLPHLTSLNLRGCPVLAAEGGAQAMALSIAPFLPSLEVFTGVEIDRSLVASQLSKGLQDSSGLSESAYFSFTPKAESNSRFRQTDRLPARTSRLQSDAPQFSERLVSNVAHLSVELPSEKTSLPEVVPDLVQCQQYGFRQSLPASTQPPVRETEESVPMFGSAVGIHHAETEVQLPRERRQSITLGDRLESIAKEECLAANEKAEPTDIIAVSALVSPPKQFCTNPEPPIRIASAAGSIVVTKTAAAEQRSALSRWKAGILQQQITPTRSPLERQRLSNQNQKGPFTPSGRPPSINSIPQAHIKRSPRETQTSTVHSFKTPVTPLLVQPKVTSSSAFPVSLNLDDPLGCRQSSTNYENDFGREAPPFGMKYSIAEGLPRMQNHFGLNAIEFRRADSSSGLMRNGMKGSEASPKSCSTLESESGMLEGTPGTLKNISLPQDDSSSQSIVRRVLRDYPTDVLSSRPHREPIRPPVSLIGVPISSDSLKQADRILRDDPSVRRFRSTEIPGTSPNSHNSYPYHSDMSYHTDEITSYWHSLSSVLVWAMDNRTQLETEFSTHQADADEYRPQILDLLIKFRKMSMAYKACMRRLGSLSSVMDGTAFTTLASLLSRRTDDLLACLLQSIDIDPRSPGAANSLCTAEGLYVLVDEYMATSPDVFTLFLSSQMFTDFAEMEKATANIIATMETEALKQISGSAQAVEKQRVQSLTALESEVFAILSSETSIVSLHQDAKRTVGDASGSRVSRTMTGPEPSPTELRDFGFCELSVRVLQLALRLKMSHVVAARRLLKIYLLWTQSLSGMAETADLLTTVVDRIVETSDKLTGVLVDHPDFIPPNSPFQSQIFSA